MILMKLSSNCVTPSCISMASHCVIINLVALSPPEEQASIRKIGLIKLNFHKTITPGLYLVFSILNHSCLANTLTIVTRSGDILYMLVVPLDFTKLFRTPCIYIFIYLQGLVIFWSEHRETLQQGRKSLSGQF